MRSIPTDIKEFLEQLGLTGTEISLYMIGLQYGPQTTAEYAKRSGIKRTTTQSALLNLTQEGMMGVHSQPGTTYYTACDPNLIERKLNEQIDELKKQQLDLINLVPLFEDISKQAITTTAATNYQGASGVKTAVDAALFCASRRWKIIAPEKNFFSENEKEYAEYFIRVRKQRGIHAKSLWEKSFVMKRKFDDVAFEFRDPRVLPDSMTGKFRTTIIIFDTSVVFINSTKELSAVLIRSAEISETLGLFFDGLWASARKIPKRYIQK